MTVFLTVDDVLEIHDAIKPCVLLDRGKLESAVAQPGMGTADGVYYYDTIYLQAGVLLHRLCKAHAFIDANKRTAWVATTVFLELNGLTIKSTVAQEAVASFVEHIAIGGITQEEVAAWLIGVCVPVQPLTD